MAGFLGGLLGVGVVLVVVISVAGHPVVIFLHALGRLLRQWRRWQAERRPRQPYDEWFDRAIWDTGAANGYRDGLDRARNPQLPSGSPMIH